MYENTRIDRKLEGFVHEMTANVNKSLPFQGKKTLIIGPYLGVMKSKNPKHPDLTTKSGSTGVFSGPKRRRDPSCAA